jgi:hypothetical protein
VADTVRYYATSKYAMAWALYRLVELARTWSGPPFEISPLSLDALENQGLCVGGDDLKLVTDLLNRQAGMVRVPE